MKKIFIVSLLAILLTGCGSSTPAAQTRPALTDPAQPIEVQAGETFNIVIDANPSTGYHWEFTNELNGKVVEYVSREYTADEPVVPGSGGVDVWIFKAVSSGETKVTLGYFPPGQDSTSPEKTAVFDIVIK